jgi:hypothetical protein
MTPLARNLEERRARPAQSGPAIGGLGQNEFWRPAMDDEHSREASRMLAGHSDVCERCGTDFALGARFCHVCGNERSLETAGRSRRSWMPRWFDLDQLRSALGMTTGAMIAFFVGIVCVLAAVITGSIYSATTLLDWQAVQIWRIEWMLAAVTAFMAGVLLKR